MESKSFAHFFVVCALLVVLVFNSACSSEVVATVVTPQLPIVEEEVSSSTPVYIAPSLPTNTPIPTDTPTPEPVATQIEDPTHTATATKISRVWSLQQLGQFMMFVGSWFLGELSVPPIPREGDSVAQLLDQFAYDKTANCWTGPVEEIDADVVCDWAFQRLEEGYSLVIYLDGKLIEDKTREERWLQYSGAVGYPGREPYCSEFDTSLNVPVFETSTD